LFWLKIASIKIKDKSHKTKVKNNISAIILAAGESKRMGFPKMLLTFEGVSMLQKVIGNVAASDVNNIIVVTGANGDMLKDIIGKYSVISCYNADYRNGMLSSVQCGFRNLPADFEAVLVFQGDQPLIKPEVINLVISAFRSSGKGIVIPVFSGKRGHPILIHSKYTNEIEKLSPYEGLRSLSYKYSDDVYEIDANDKGILRDFDTLEDYYREINQS
jgi:molybdenum cofactor cytidylyltransferase